MNVVNRARSASAIEEPQVRDSDEPDPEEPPSAVRVQVSTLVHRLRHVDTFTLVAAVLVLVPAVTAVVTALREPWIPTTDWARIELAVRDVGTADTPLVGAYSRFGWDHPGPLMFYAMAPFYRLVAPEHGLLFATAVTNLLFTLALVLVVLRYPLARALIVLAAFALYQRGVGVADLTDPWNPSVSLMPFALYLLLCVEVAEGRRSWPLPAAVAVASFVGQSHAGMLPAVVLIGGTAIGLRLWRMRRLAGADPRSGVQPLTARTVALTGALGFFLWLPPLIDQVARTGNLGHLVRFTLGMDDTPLGPIQEGAMPPGDVLTSSSWLLNPLGPWLRFPGTEQQYGFPLLGHASPVFLLLTVGIVAAAALLPWYASREASRAKAADAGKSDSWNPDDSWNVSAAAVAAAGLVAVVAAMISLRGVPFYYLGRWTGTVVLMAWVAFGWSVVLALRTYRALGRSPWLDGSGELRVGPVSLGSRAFGGVVAGLTGVIVLTTVLHETVGDQPVKDHSDAYRRLEPELERVAQEEEPIATSLDRDLILFNDFTHGFVVWMDRNGIDWIDAASDPAARGRYFYVVEPMDGLEVMEQFGLEIVATSGDPQTDEEAERELALTRVPVDRIAGSSPAELEGLEDLDLEDFAEPE